ESPAVQHYRRPSRQAKCAIRLCPARGKIEDLDRMPLAIRLKERRQRDLDPRVDSAVRKRTVVWWGRNGARHIPTVLAWGCCQEVNALGLLSAPFRHSELDGCGLSGARRFAGQAEYGDGIPLR